MIRIVEIVYCRKLRIRSQQMLQRMEQVRRKLRMEIRNKNKTRMKRTKKRRSRRRPQRKLPLSLMKDRRRSSPVLTRLPPTHAFLFTPTVKPRVVSLTVAWRVYQYCWTTELMITRREHLK